MRAKILIESLIQEIDDISPVELTRVEKSTSRIMPDWEEGEPEIREMPPKILSVGEYVKYNNKSYRIKKVIGNSLVLDPGDISVFSNQVNPIS